MNQVNWPNVVNFIIEECYYKPKDIAEACGVSQQSVSLWKVNLQIPRPEVKQVLTDILTNEGVGIDAFIDKNEEEITDKEPLELIDIFQKLPLSKQIAVIEVAKFQKEQMECAQFAYQI